MSVYTTPPSAVPHTYRATYGSDSNNAGSNASLLVNVTKANSATAASVPASAAIGAVTLGATVTGINAAGQSPSGSVGFYEGSTLLTSAPLSSQSASQAAASGTVNLAAGLHTIVARYGGDGSYVASLSQAVQTMVSNNGALPPGAPMQWTYQYDADGNQTHVIDANSANTQQDYDSLSRNTKITAPAPQAGASGPITNLAYDLRDQIASVNDPRHLSTSYTTDGLGNTSAISSPDTKNTGQTFYDNGLVHTTTDARQRTATYTYDELNRVLSISYTSGTATTFTYDYVVNACAFGIGRLCLLNDESGYTSFNYDGFGHVTSKAQSVTAQTVTKSFAVSYGWGSSGSATGKLQTLTYPSGAQVSYGFDAAGRVNSVSVTAGGVATTVLSGLGYTANGQPQSWVWGDSTPYQRTFDGYGRLATYPLGNPAGSGASAGVTRTLIFDVAGRISGYAHAGNGAGVDQTFGYDGLDRLISATDASHNYGYEYDDTGNRKTQIINGTRYPLGVDSNSNRYTSIVDAQGSYVPQYTAAGAWYSDRQGPYSYSDRGRLQSATVAGNTYSYLYNGFEQRVVKYGPAPVIPSGRQYYVYDEAGHLLGEYDANGNVIFETVYVGDLPVAALTPSGTSTAVAYIYADHLNTARVIARSTDHAIVWQWGSSEPFGVTQANGNPNGFGAYTYDPRFPGQVADAETGWNYNWYRDYQPQLGRYAQSDPIGLAGGVNTYGYVEASPLMAIDVSGLIPLNSPSALCTMCHGPNSPFPYSPPVTQRPMQRETCPPGPRDNKAECEKRCEANYDWDMTKCETKWKMSGRNPAVYQACQAQAQEALIECMQECK